MGWSDPDWKWGYASGAAHVAAADIRKRLDTEEVCVLADAAHLPTPAPTALAPEADALEMPNLSMHALPINRRVTAFSSPCLRALLNSTTSRWRWRSNVSGRATSVTTLTTAVGRV